MLFVRIDWTEGHRDVCVLDVEGSVRVAGIATARPTRLVDGSRAPVLGAGGALQSGDPRTD
jgi:hypothetical protein